MSLLHLTRSPFRSGRRPARAGFLGALGAALLLLLLLSACGSTATGTTPQTSAPSPTASTGQSTTLLAVLPLLQKSQQATLQLTSFHFALSGKGTLQTSGQLLPALARATPFRLSGSGDASLANRQEKGKGVLTLMPAQGQAVPLSWSERLIGSKLYVRGTTRQWYVLDLGQLPQFLGIAGTMPPIQPLALLPLAQIVSVEDHGTTTLSGAQVRHITLSLPQDALAQLAGHLGQTRLAQLLGSIQLKSALTADLFIDVATARLIRAELKGSLQVNVDTLLSALGLFQSTPGGATARTLSVAFDLTLTLSKFNQKVAAVTAPTGAIPIVLGTHP
jgi:hypothetical protein